MPCFSLSLLNLSLCLSVSLSLCLSVSLFQFILVHCFSGGKQFEQYKQCKQCQQCKQCMGGASSITDGIFNHKINLCNQGQESCTPSQAVIEPKLPLPKSLQENFEWSSHQILIQKATWKFHWYGLSPPRSPQYGLKGKKAEYARPKNEHISRPDVTCLGREIAPPCRMLPLQQTSKSTPCMSKKHLRENTGAGAPQ